MVVKMLPIFWTARKEEEKISFVLFTENKKAVTQVIYFYHPNRIHKLSRKGKTTTQQQPTNSTATHAKSSWTTL